MGDYRGLVGPDDYMGLVPEPEPAPMTAEPLVDIMAEVARYYHDRANADPSGCLHGRSKECETAAIEWLQDTPPSLAARVRAAEPDSVTVEAIDLLCQLGLGTDMGTTAPVSEALRDAIAARYQEREQDGAGVGMSIEDWRYVIDAELPPLLAAPAAVEGEDG